MKKITLLLFLSFGSFALLHAQVTFVVQSLPSYTPAKDTIFIAGDFTGWQAGLPEYMMHKNDEGKWSITLAAKSKGTVIKYKFTHGSWDYVEKGRNGEETDNRIFTYSDSSSVVDITIYNWANAGGGSTSTAATNVKIMSTDFYMPQLERKRKVWIYFPPDYETSGIRYPVLYMHDGQNLFDVKTSYAGEWEVDETLNKLAAQGKKVPIVIGIDNGGGNRIDEYAPWSNPQNGGGDGEKYMQFIVETLKPYIDEHYRTLTDRENTGIMGSSLGGLISHYGSLKYQNTFSKAGLLSPSYWFSDSIWAFTHDTGKQYDMRFFQLCGSGEGVEMITKMQRMNDSLVILGFGQGNIFNKVIPDGQHNEKLWRESFGEAYLWLFNSFTNSIKTPLEHKGKITCSPNPVEYYLTFNTDNKIPFDTIKVINMQGRIVKTLNNPRMNKIDVNDLAPGIYIIQGFSGNKVFEGKFVKK